MTNTNNLPGLREYIDYRFTRPRQMDRESYDVLSAAERAAYDDLRLEWFGAGFWLSTSETKNLLTSVNAYLRTSSRHSAGGQRMVVLTGPANIGKTTALLRLALEIESRYALRYPDYRRDGDVPAVYVQMPANATPKMVAAVVLDFFGTIFSERRTQRDLINQATALLRERRTQLLIVDEFQMLRLHGTQGDDAINALKSIINNVGVVTVLAGVGLTGKLSGRAAEQIMARGETQALQPFSRASEADRARWAGLVRVFVHEMYLVDGTQDLSKYADLLYGLSHGRIGNLRRILSRAFFDLIDGAGPGKPEVFTESVLCGAATAEGVTVPKPKASMSSHKKDAVAG